MKYDFPEIAVASFIGLFLAYIMSYAYTKNIVNAIGYKLGAYLRFGPEDLWVRFQKDYGMNYVVIRDHKVGLYYYGFVPRYSDSAKNRELIIEDVSVFNSDGELCYETDSIYISREFNEITIEFKDAEKESAKVEE